MYSLKIIPTCSFIIQATGMTLHCFIPLKNMKVTTYANVITIRGGSYMGSKTLMSKIQKVSFLFDAEFFSEYFGTIFIEI